MALYDQNDFVNRLLALTPFKRWAGFSALQPPTTATSQDGGVIYSQLLAAAISFAYMMTVLAFVRLQTRLATIEDPYVDLASQDFFGANLPRMVGELANAYATRIRQRIVAPSGTHAAVLSAVTQYFAANQNTAPPIFDVFDAQSDPVRFEYYGLTNAQFAVILYYPYTVRQSAWYLGRAGLGQSTVVSDPYAFTVSQTAPTPGLAAAVNMAKDWTYRPIYIVSRGEPPNIGTWGVPSWDALQWSSS